MERRVAVGGEALGTGDRGERTIHAVTKGLILRTPTAEAAAGRGVFGVAGWYDADPTVPHGTIFQHVDLPCAHAYFVAP